MLPVPAVAARVSRYKNRPNIIYKKGFACEAFFVYLFIKNSPINVAIQYDEQAILLARAIDIAVNSLSKFLPKDWSESHRQQFKKVYLEWKEDALKPSAKFKNIASLNYTKNAVFTYFQEGFGEEVNYFWSEIKKANLPYRRENKMAKILKSGKIKNQIQYDFVIDVIVPYQQEELITEEDVIILNELIKEFETRASKRSK
ncbi:hypothetical protein [Mucilaginibacter psychrotolerans]|uniref:hypothetical protein n=1 Tax=Mucilaginibacter psychrotolerans TaxID=1524096 RepID=UPI0013050A75|nr:hypothetical protein [Mucilaginibacter psychrotolerans]